MKNHCYWLYQKMQAQIRIERSQLASEAEFLERCFAIGHEYWERLKIWVSANGFSSQSEEIHFFREIKPEFIAIIEYSTQRYHELLFRPNHNAARLAAYWEHELNRTAQFFQTNGEFYQYYKSGSKDRDENYFTLSSASPVPSFSGYFASDQDWTTGHDLLVARIKGFESYAEYVRGLLAN